MLCAVYDESIGSLTRDSSCLYRVFQGLAKFFVD